MTARSKVTKKSVDSPEPKPVSAQIKSVILKPRISEKGYALSETLNTYVFDAPTDANKLDIAVAVAAQYNVGVTNVRIASVPGKAVRSYRQRGRRSIGAKRSDLRKAYVTLKDGDKLPVFAAADVPEPPQEAK